MKFHEGVLSRAETSLLSLDSAVYCKDNLQHDIALFNCGTFFISSQIIISPNYHIE